MKLSLSLILLFVCGMTHAEERATIEQMKGRRAIIRFEKDIPFSVGQTITTTTSEGNEFGYLTTGRNLLERKNSLSFSSSISNLATKTKGTSGTSNTTEASAEIKYGWNLKQFEVGPVVSLTQYKATLEVTTFSIGGFFEYNLVPNLPGHDLIWGPQAQVLTETQQTKTSSSSSNDSLITLQAGMFAKWFILSPVLALRFDGYYKYGTQDSTTTSGLVFGAGLNHYF